MNKIILLVIYVVLVSSSVYNLYSFKPDVGMGIELRKGISKNLQNYIVISNISENKFKNIDVLINSMYYLHIYEIEERNDYNAFSTEFLKINTHPRYSSRILLKKEENKIKKMEEANNIFSKKVNISVFKKGEYYHKKL